MNPRRWDWPTTIIVSALAVSIFTFAMGDNPARPLVALWFLLVCPGAALLGVIGVRDGMPRFVIGVAVSIALETAASLIMVYSGLWHPEVLLVGLVLFCMVGGGYELINRVPAAERSAP